MPVTIISAVIDTPEFASVAIGQGSASGTATPINVGDWLAWSGHFLQPTNAGHTAYWKASGAGVAIEANPVYDPQGRVISNSALRFVRMGVLRVSADFSGEATFGNGIYPDATGSGVAAPTGNSGVRSTWQTSVKLPLALTGNTGAGGSGVATVLKFYNVGNGGTGQYDILLMPPAPDFY